MKIWQLRILSGGSFLVFSLLVANVLNFVFNAYLGRVLSLSEFGLITFINTLMYVLNITLTAVAVTVVHKVAYINSQQGPKKATLYFRRLEKSIMFRALLVMLVFLILTPVLTHIFHIHTITVLLMLSPAILAMTMGIMNRAYLQGRLLFLFVGFIVLVEPVLKLIFSLLLVQLQLNELVYLVIPISSFFTAITAFGIVRFKSRAYVQSLTALRGDVEFPFAFFGAALITGLANNLFITFDVLLVKHYFTPENSGVYSLLSLVGKMVYFLGTILTGFMVSLVSTDMGAKRDPTRTFNFLFIGTVVIVLSSVIGLIALGDIVLPLALGERAQIILPFVPLYAMGIGAYTISAAILVYHLARKHYSFSAISLFISILLAIGIMLYHDNITEVVTVIFYLSIINLITMAVMHIIHTYGVSIIRNAIDFACLFLPIPEVHIGQPGKRILMFNWRDTRHVFAGGAEIYIHELARRWVKKGYSVTLFCGNDQKCEKYEMIDGVDIVRRGGFYTVYIWAFLYYIFRFRGRYDIILDCQNGVPFFTPLYAKEKVYCIMFHVHQKVFRESLALPFALLASYLEANIMPWAYRHIEFITISESTKKEMEEHGMGKAGIHIVSPGVDTSFLVPGEKEKEPLIIYLGRLKKYKCVDMFLQSIPDILSRVKNARFIVAGDGEERNRLKELAQKLNIHDKVTFIGKITEEKKRELYQRAWLFFNPSMMEGWAITNIEASACGTPVVAANVPGMRDSVNNPHMGYLVAHGDIPGFTEKVVSLIQNKELWSKMSANAVQWAKRFEWMESADKGLKIIHGKR